MKSWIRQFSQKSIQTQTLSFRQQSVRVERKAFRRSISIIIKPEEGVIVRAGLKVPDKVILGFLQERSSWIDKHLQKFAEQKEKFPEKKLIHSETFPFLGKDLGLKLIPTPLKQVFFSQHENFLNMHIPLSLWDQVSAEELQVYWPELQKFYLKQAAQFIPERLKIWSDQMQLFPTKLSLRNQKSRWGSCSSQGCLSINWRLMAAPIEVLDYVLVHELAHLKHMNHSHKFWELVEKNYPHYQQSEKWLKEKQELLRFLKR